MGGWLQNKGVLHDMLGSDQLHCSLDLLWWLVCDPLNWLGRSGYVSSRTSGILVVWCAEAGANADCGWSEEAQFGLKSVGV